MSEVKDSSAIQFLSVLWEHRQEETGHSWMRMNQSMREGLSLAVRMGLRFDPGDLLVCSDRFRAGYWVGESLEWFYREAVAYGNRSAWKCFEAYVGRTPFVWEYADAIKTDGGGGGGGVPARLVVGSRFAWRGEVVTVTSFCDDANPKYLNACSYARDDGERCSSCSHFKTYPSEQILRRYKITHVDFKAKRKEIREQAMEGK